ncbi:KH domain-containing protein 3 [Pteronotus mesoamericanus]|uniref:KH domain-containing protein 3 n=1 Tax=Pteronotus mesoamericanus TaxID=1884717 RepID=UPI0023ECE444|nr:KH domain-containing protein 3 [Pteronotus parnellii mesoamericanus]
MATPKRFPTLVQLEQREGALFQMLSNITKRPYWFQSEYLKSPKAVHLEAWLVEAIFGPGGEHIPHVECVSQTLLRINQWDPEGEAEILIFGRPSYQKDVSKMIMNLAYYHRQLRAQSTGPGIVRGPWTDLGFLGRDPDVSWMSRGSGLNLLVYRSGFLFARDLRGQTDPMLSGSGKNAAQDTETQKSPAAVREPATQRSPGAAREAATQRSPGAAREAATQSSPDATLVPVPRL